MEKRKKILLVDDDEIFLDIANKILEQKYEIVVTTSCNGALKKIVSGVIPDLIFLDIVMPEVDGWEAYKILKGISLLHDVPIVFLTLLNSIEDKEHAKKMGVTDYITKPIEKDYLLEKTEEIFRKKDKKRSCE